MRIHPDWDVALADVAVKGEYIPLRHFIHEVAVEQRIRLIGQDGRSPRELQRTHPELFAEAKRRHIAWLNQPLRLTKESAGGAEAVEVEDRLTEQLQDLEAEGVVFRAGSRGVFATYRGKPSFWQP